MDLSQFPYGERAKALLLELKRAEWLPQYDEEAVRSVLEECTKIYNMMNEIYSEEDLDRADVKITINILHLSICRNKRCLLAYHDFRLKKLETLWWESASAVLPADKASKLSAKELEYYSQYQRIVSETMEHMSLDLTMHLHPPQDLYREVQVLEDAGEVILQSGSQVVLEKDSIHYLRKTDVEHLIRQGVLRYTS